MLTQGTLCSDTESEALHCLYQEYFLVHTPVTALKHPLHMILFKPVPRLTVPGGYSIYFLIRHLVGTSPAVQPWALPSPQDHGRQAETLATLEEVKGTDDQGQ